MLLSPIVEEVVLGNVASDKNAVSISETIFSHEGADQSMRFLHKASFPVAWLKCLLLKLHLPAVKVVYLHVYNSMGILGLKHRRASF